MAVQIRQAVSHLAKAIPTIGTRRAITSRITTLNTTLQARQLCVLKSSSSSSTTVVKPFTKMFQPSIASTFINKRWYSDDVVNVEEQTQDVLRLFDKIDPSKVSLEAHLVHDLGLDSLDVVEVIMAFEDEFSIEITDTEAETITTVQQCIDLINTKLA